MTCEEHQGTAEAVCHADSRLLLASVAVPMARYLKTKLAATDVNQRTAANARCDFVWSVRRTVGCRVCPVAIKDQLVTE